MWILPIILPAQGFKVSGNVILSEETGTNYFTTTFWTFEAKVLGDQYLYTVFFTNGQTFSFGSDGRDNYSLMQDPKLKKSGSGGIGVVNKGQYPIDSFTTATALPWIAFCSADYLKITGSNEYNNLPAAWLRSGMLEAGLYKVKADPLPDGTGLPGRLEYIIDGEKMWDLKAGVHDPSWRPTTNEFARAISMVSKFAGYSAAVFQVEKTTNWMGSALPTKFSFTHFQLQAPGSNAIGKIASRIDAEIVAVKPLATLDPIPKSSDPLADIQVDDYRFANITNGVVFLMYGTAQTGGWLTNKADPYLQKLYQKDVSTRKWLIPESVPRFVFLTVMIVLPLIFLFALALVLSWLKNSKKSAD